MKNHFEFLLSFSIPSPLRSSSTLIVSRAINWRLCWDTQRVYARHAAAAAGGGWKISSHYIQSDERKYFKFSSNHLLSPISSTISIRTSKFISSSLKRERLLVGRGVKIFFFCRISELFALYVSRSTRRGENLTSSHRKRRRENSELENCLCTLTHSDD